MRSLAIGAPDRGFSLIEVLVATAITVGVGAIVFQLFHQNERVFRDENARAETQQTARMVIFQIGDDIRITGQGIPAALGDIILPGSSGQRLNLRAGFSAVETTVTNAPPITAVVGTSITLSVEDTTGLSAGRQIFVWNAEGWLRATVTSVSGSAMSVRMTPSAGSAQSLQFSTPPQIGLDEAIAIYLDTSTDTIRRTTSTNTTNAASPTWAPANDVGTNIVGLDFLYFDSGGNALIPTTPQSRAAVRAIEARVTARAASLVAGSTQPRAALSVKVHPRNLEYE
jgi:prepilin-type N-terminal cleavage/methylation domain-containing protein